MKRLFIAITLALLAVPIFAQKSSSISADGKLQIDSIKIYYSNATGWQSEPLDNGSAIKVRDAATKQVISTEDFAYQNGQVTIDLQGIESKITLQSPSTYFENISSKLEEVHTDVKIGTVILTAYDNRGKRIGDLVQSNVILISNNIKDGEKITIDIVLPIYSIGQFSYNSKDKMMGLDVNFNINLIKGWNIMMCQTCSGADGVSMSLYTSTIPDKSTEWIVMSTESKPSTDAESGN